MYLIEGFDKFIVWYRLHFQCFALWKAEVQAVLAGFGPATLAFSCERLNHLSTEWCYSCDAMRYPPLYRFESTIFDLDQIPNRCPSGSHGRTAQWESLVRIPLGLLVVCQHIIGKPPSITTYSRLVKSFLYFQVLKVRTSFVSLPPLTSAGQTYGTIQEYPQLAFNTATW